MKTCPKGFGLKVVKLRLKTLLKINEAIWGNRRAIGGNLGQLRVIEGNRGNQRAIGGQSGAIRGRPWGAIEGHQRPSGALRDNRRQSGGNWEQTGASWRSF